MAVKLVCVCETSWCTNLHLCMQAMADRLTDIVCDAVLTIRKPDEPIDLYMVGIQCPSLQLTQSSDLRNVQRRSS